MDAGIATQSNILWLKEKGYGYIVVSRKRKSDLLPETDVTLHNNLNESLVYLSECFV
jgi:hypothetical protein